MFKKALLVIIAIVACGLAAQAQVPAVTLNDIEGNPVRTDTLARPGHPIIVSFFATWCKPCQRELSAIADVYDEWQQETGVEVIAVSIDEGPNVNRVKPLVDANGWPYRVLLDTAGEFKRALGIQLIPFVMVIDENGNVIYKHNGYTDGAENELREVLDKKG